MAEVDVVTRDIAYGIVANVVSDRALRTGAKVWIHYHNGDAENPIVIGLSKSGRRIRKYTKYRHLKNFRVAWIPPNLRQELAFAWEYKEGAEKWAEAFRRRWQR